MIEGGVQLTVEVEQVCVREREREREGEVNVRVERLDVLGGLEMR